MNESFSNIIENLLPDLDSRELNIVLADGEFPCAPYLIDLLFKAKSSGNLICCDGAINKLIKHNITPHWIIGDCDSISSVARHYLETPSAQIIKAEDQEINDLTKAINFARTKHLDKIIILGATGLREDHTLANISLLVEYTKIIKNVIMLSDYGVFSVHLGNWRIPTMKGLQVSFFSLNEANTVTCKELKWPLINYKFKSLYSATLNEATENFIDLTSTHEVLVYRSFTIK